MIRRITPPPTPPRLSSQELGVRPDITEAAVAACDSLLLLLTSAGGADGGRRLRAPLRCAASLARDDATAALLLESVGGLARAAPPGPARRALLEALCAVGCERPHVLAPLASDVLAMLEAPDTDGDTTVSSECWAEWHGEGRLRDDKRLACCWVWSGRWISGRLALFDQDEHDAVWESR